MTTKTITPKTTLVQCPCPRCFLGAHYQPELAERYRKHAEWRERAEKAEAEVERLKALPHFHHESYCRKCKEAR
jgi:hypothetical protein